MTALPPDGGWGRLMIVAAAVTGWLIGLALCANVISYRQKHPTAKTMLRR